MPHQPGDRVTNIEPIGTQIPADTPGTITGNPDQPTAAYFVRFDNHPGELAMYPNEIQDQP